MKVLLLSFLFFGVAWAALNCECGKRNAGRIVGGKETKKNEYPWMVAFQRNADNFVYCGGTIVTPWHIVTAAHCVDDYGPRDITLFVGAHDVNDVSDVTRQQLFMDQKMVHPDYNPISVVNDIAVIVPTAEIKYNDFVGPLCMPHGMSEDKLIGLIVKATGWGRYDYRRPNTDKIKKLREVDLEITSAATCTKSSGTKVCTWSAGKDTCTGDSGGPLAWLDPETNRFTFVGVVSYGPEHCGNSADPGVNSNVVHFQSWINEKIAGSVGKSKNAKTCHKE